MNAHTMTQDPVTLEIIRSLLIAIVDEAEINLSRTALSPIIYEVKDYCVCLLDKEARTISQSRGGIPTFMADLGEAVRDGLEIYGEKGFEPGDVAIINYSGVCGQHLNNVVMYAPIFWKGELIAFAANRAHWSDVGGAVAGSFATNSTEIYQEGLQIRTVKIVKRGQMDEEIARMIRYNIRFPDLTFGDIAAQLSACELIVRRTGELLQKYGWELIRQCIDAIWSQSEAAVRSYISQLPPGRYEAESFLDDDGINPDRTLPIKVAVTIAGDELEIDFTGTADQTRGPMNSGESGAFAAARVAFKSLIASDMPPNDGAFRPLKIKLPPGTMISAKGSAAMAHWNMSLKTVIDTIYKAFSAAMPDRVPAAHHAGQGLYLLNGTDPKTGERYSMLDTTLGGWGAQPDHDGFSPMKTTTHGDTRNIPIEVEETFFPIRVERWEWRSDSAGAGRYRGGLGLRKVYRILEDCSLIAAFERTKCPPWGLFGGQPAKTGCVIVRNPGEEPKEFRKVTSYPLKRGGTIELLSAGGGGRGSSFERPIDEVIADIRDGYITAEGARDDYGVVIDPATLSVDTARTDKLRAAPR